MWRSPSRRAHLCNKTARVSLIDGGSFQHVALALGQRTLVKLIARGSRVPMTNVPAMVFGEDSGLCGCNNFVGSRCCSKETVLARFQIVRTQQSG
eukprot:5223117-Pyramimonas_sp.AAC.1